MRWRSSRPMPGFHRHQGADRRHSSSVRQIVQKILHGSVFNCEIAEAGDGETALTLARNTQFDVVFLDCNMPGISGIATMKRLALVQPSLKIVMISAERSAICETEALDCGACAFLHKPFNSPDVDHVLHAAFGLRSPNLKMNSTAPNFDVAIEGSTSVSPTEKAVTYSNICGAKTRLTCAMPSSMLPPAPWHRAMSRRWRKRRRCCNCVRPACSRPRP